jgi:hypothetical protein
MEKGCYLLIGKRLMAFKKPENCEFHAHRPPDGPSV